MAARPVLATMSRAQPPEHLDPEERRLWSSIVRDYRFAGDAELDVLCATLEAHQRMRRLRQQIDAEGETTDGKYGKIAHPLLRHEAVARSAYLNGMRMLRLDLGTRR